MDQQPTNAELYGAIMNVYEATSLFSKRVDARFDQIDARSDRLERRMDRVEVCLTNVEDRLGALTIETRERFERLGRRLLAVERR